MADALAKHAFVSAIPEGADATKIRTSAWNAPLLFTGGAAGDVLTRDTGSATGAAWSPVTLTARAAPTPVVGKAILYLDVADDDLKVIFGDGTIKTLATNP